MSNIGLKTIVVKEKTYSDLLRLKNHPKDSFDSVVRELLENDKKKNKK